MEYSSLFDDKKPKPPVMPRRLSAPELIAADLPERETILDPILQAQGLALLYGPRGLGKTFVALEWPGPPPPARAS